MCGFSGILSNRPIAAGAIEKSLDAIKHRGIDDSLLYDGDNRKFFSSPNLSNAITSKTFPPAWENSRRLFGFNRLSIVDLSENAMQPFFDEASGCLCMINGEIYNYAALRKQYLPQVALRSASDSEVAFKLYLRLGNDFIHQLRGMFSIVIYDLKQDILKVWRDHMGMKPFYYHKTEHQFIFSSEMKGIFATGLLQPEIDCKGLAYSMYLGTCPAPLSIYKNIHSLQPGHSLEYSFSSGVVKTAPYWVLSYQPSKSRSTDELANDIEQLAALHTTGDVKKALMLSGGLDSGVLAHYIVRKDNKITALNAFSKGHHTDEREFAAASLENTGMQLTFLEMDSKPSKEIIEDYLLTEEEPNYDAEPAHFVCREAQARNIRVLYNGLGPDELFGGYHYYRKANSISRYHQLLRLLPPLIPGSYGSKLQLLTESGWAAYPLVARNRISWPEITKFLKQNAQPVPLHPVQFILEQCRSLNSQFVRMPLLKQMSWIDFHYYIGSHHGMRSDQSAMKYSVEMRFPYMDHIFVEKYFNDPDTFGEVNKCLKPRFRKLAERVLPQKTLRMPKKGFTMPTDVWAGVLSGKPNITNPQKEWYLAGLRKLIAANDLDGIAL